MDRSVEMRLRLEISNFMRNANSAGREMDGLTARAAALDAALDRVEASSARAAAGLRDTRTQVRGVGRESERAAPQIAAAQARLDAFNASAQQGTRGQAAFARSTRDTGNQLDSSGRQIDRFSGRIGLAVDGVLTLGSALIPVGAIALQAAGGLAALGAAAAVGLGSAVLAFQGLGDAVKKVQEWQDDPTADNLREAREELDKLSPAARQFAMEFQKTRPLFSDIQDAAAEGWFPGLTKALGDADKLAPKLEKILTQSGQMGGALVAGDVESLAGPRWDEFYDFVANEAPSAMASLNRIIGDLGHGAAEMWMKLDPGNDSFIAWIENAANAFDQWASSAEGTQDIEAFLAYARENGPAVADFLAAIGSALIDVVQAAAPLGGPTLQILTAIAEAFGAIADSDMATPILAGLAALRLFNRAQTLVVGTQERFAAATRQTTAAQAASARVTNAQTARATAVGASANAWNPGYSATRGQGNYGANLAAALTAPRAQDVRAAEAARRAQRNSRIVGGAGMAAGVGLLASGAASEIGLTNTAMLGLAGTMAGPWGAAAGLAAGAAMDAAAANNDLTESLSAAKAVLDSGDMASQLTALADAQKKQAEFAGKMAPSQGTTGALKDSFNLGKVKNGVEGWFGDSDVEEGQKALENLESQQYRNQAAAADLAMALGMQIGPLDDSARSAEELQKALDAAKPAMDALGISQERLVAGSTMEDWADGGTKVSSMMRAIGEAAVAAGAGSDDLNASIAQWIADSDSATAKLEDYRAVIQSLAADEGTAAEQADRFRAAMDALVDPTLDAEEALSRQREVLKAISELNAKGGFTDKNEVGRQNLATTRDYTKAVEERIATMINADRSEEDIAHGLAKSREQFIKSGMAAGFSAQQMQRRADAIKLTPQLIETTFRDLGFDKGERAIRNVQAQLRSLPQKVQTQLITGGVPKSRADAQALAKQYDLTAKQRKTLFSLVDRASGPARALNSVLNEAARDRQSTITITTRRRLGDAGVGPERFNSSGKAAADGDTVPKTGLPYADRHLYLLADGEEVISNRNGQADRHRSLLKAINAGRLAEGGTAGGGSAGRSRRSGGGGPVDFDSVHTFAVGVDAATDKVKTFKQRLNEAERALAKETRQRDEARALRDSAGGTLSLAELTGGGLSGFNLGLSANTNDTNAGAAALAKLRGKGLGGKNDKGGLFQFLASSGDLGLLQEFAGLSRGQINKYEQRYASLDRAQDRLGNAAVIEKYGESIQDMSRDVRHLDKVTDRLEKTINNLGKKVENGAREGTRQGNQEKDRRTAARARAGR